MATDFATVELSKENLQPIKRGRDLSKAGVLNATLSEKDAQQQYVSP